MNSNKKRKIGIIMGVLVWLIIQIALYIIKINNINNMFIIGVMTAGGIIFILSINLGKNRIGPKMKLALSITALTTCILCSADILITNSSNQQYDTYKYIFLVIIISSFISFFALILSFGILYIQMTKKS